MALAAAVVVVGTVAVVPLETALAVAGALAGAALLLFFVTSPRYGLTLTVFLLYVALLDGYVRLKTNSPYAALIRDGLLYGLLVGALVRATVQRRQLTPPPWTGWVVAFVALVVVQIFNPANVSAWQVAAGVRQQLEWVPLFFVGALLLRDEQTLRRLLLLLVVVAGINGVVSVIQVNMTPEELAGWGPGYEERVLGTGAAFEGAGRVYWDAAGESRTRPLGLGSDFGFGGLLGLIALPAGISLLMLRQRGVVRILLLLCLLGGLVAILTSQSRTLMIGAGGTLLAFILLASASGRRASLVAGLVAAAAVGGVVTFAIAGRDSALLERYSTLTPKALVQVTKAERGGIFELTRDYLRDFPLGAGLARTGPAALQTAPERQLIAESQINYLLIEVGIVGLLLFGFFALRLLTAASRAVRALPSAGGRLSVAAVAAPLFGFVVMWPAGPITAGVAGGAYFWLAAGILAYHTHRGREGVL